MLLYSSLSHSDVLLSPHGEQLCDSCNSNQNAVAPLLLDRDAIFWQFSLVRVRTNRSLLKLNMELCRAYEEGDTFYIQIARDTRIDKGKEAIVAKDVNTRFAVDSRLLTLYLARANDVWLQDEVADAL